MPGLLTAPAIGTSMTGQNRPPRGDRASECNRARIIVAADARLGEVRSRVSAVSAHVEKVLGENRGMTCDHFEAAQAQLLVFLLRAERQVGLLKTTETSAWGSLLKDLELTWDDLALATQRLVCRLEEASDVAVACRRHGGEQR